MINTAYYYGRSGVGNGKALESRQSATDARIGYNFPKSSSHAPKIICGF
jgi:hypothetical protein